MEKITQNKLTLKIICVALAIILWFYVSYQENPSMTETIKNVPISLTGEQALKENGFSVFKVSESSVDVIATAKRLTLARLSNKNISATINVSSIKSAGKYSFPVTISTSLTDDASFTAKGKNIVVTIEPIVSKTYSIEADFSPARDSSLKVNTFSLSEDEIKVTAPESILKEIDCVKTEKITPEKDVSTQTAGLVVYGKNGKPIEGAECSPSEIEVSFSFYHSKTVPVVLKTTSGKTYTLPDTSKIKIYGTNKNLAEVTQIETEELSIAQFDIGSSVRLKLNLPDNIFLDDIHPGDIEVILQEEYFN